MKSSSLSPLAFLSERPVAPDGYTKPQHGTWRDTSNLRRLLLPRAEANSAKMKAGGPCVMRWVDRSVVGRLLSHDAGFPPLRPRVSEHPRQLEPRQLLSRAVATQASTDRESHGSLNGNRASSAAPRCSSTSTRRHRSCRDGLAWRSSETGECSDGRTAAGSATRGATGGPMRFLPRAPAHPALQPIRPDLRTAAVAPGPWLADRWASRGDAATCRRQTVRLPNGSRTSSRWWHLAACTCASIAHPRSLHCQARPSTFVPRLRQCLPPYASKTPLSCRGSSWKHAACPFTSARNQQSAEDRRSTWF